MGVNNKNLAQIWTEKQEQMETYISDHQLFTKEDKILVAVSGGPDSIFLAHILTRLKYHIGIIHINYQLRGEESEAEAQLVENWAQQWKLPFFIKTFNTPALLKKRKDSLQMLARELRYQFFAEILSSHHFDYCATAHHANDQAESIILSLIKGNSFDLIHPIPAQRNPYVRPLLFMKKEEIVALCDYLNLPYAIDSSNNSLTYQRNIVRHSVLPALQDLHPQPTEQLTKRASWYELQGAFIKHELEKWVSESPKEFTLRWNSFEAYYPSSFTPLLIAYTLEKWNIHGHDIWNVIQLYESQVGRKVLTDRGVVRRVRDGIQLEKTEERNHHSSNKEEKSPPKPIVISSIAKLNQKTSFYFKGKWLKIEVHPSLPIVYGIPNVFYLDADKITFPMRIRSWQAGDRMIPFGMAHPKKLSDIFIDEKWSHVQKAEAIIVESQHHIFVLSDFRIDDRVKITPQTERILKIEVKKGELEPDTCNTKEE